MGEHLVGKCIEVLFDIVGEDDDGKKDEYKQWLPGKITQLSDGKQRQKKFRA